MSSRARSPEWDAIYSDAARQAATAAEHIRHCVRSEPDQAADAARAAADTLHVAARITHNRNLRCAADAYDRAARMPFGRTPCRIRDGDRLCTVARVLAMTGGMDDDSLPLAATALIANLIGLAVAVAELRQAQRHAAQAAAARAAAEQLHMAHAQLRARVRSFGRAEAQRPARPRDATSQVSREFPYRRWPVFANQPNQTRPTWRPPRRDHGTPAGSPHVPVLAAGTSRRGSAATRPGGRVATDHARTLSPARCRKILTVKRS
jgi:hypothetical protein